MAVREMQQADVAERLDAVVERGAFRQIERRARDGQSGGGGRRDRLRGIRGGSFKVNDAGSPPADDACSAGG